MDSHQSVGEKGPAEIHPRLRQPRTKHMPIFLYSHASNLGRRVSPRDGDMKKIDREINKDGRSATCVGRSTLHLVFWGGSLFPNGDSRTTPRNMSTFEGKQTLLVKGLAGEASGGVPDSPGASM